MENARAYAVLAAICNIGNEKGWLLRFRLAVARRSSVSALCWHREERNSEPPLFRSLREREGRLDSVLTARVAAAHRRLGGGAVALGAGDAHDLAIAVAFDGALDGLVEQGHLLAKNSPALGHGGVGEVL
jgi:hypothetical protein